MLGYHEEELKNYFYNALSSLTNARTIRCVFHGTVFQHLPNFARNLSAGGYLVEIAVTDAIKTFSNLQRFYMFTYHVSRVMVLLTMAIHVTTCQNTTLEKNNLLGIIMNRFRGRYVTQT